jgi:CspA family cold shock protein
MGTVNWFNDAKGFGFLHVDDTGEDVYVHREEVDVLGGISEGQRVWFDIVAGNKGPEAENVTLVGE